VKEKTKGMDSTKWQRRRDILISIICIGVIVWVSWKIAGQFFDTIIILLLSMAIAFLLSPLVNFLTRYKVPRVVATVLVYVIVLAILGAIGYGLIFSLIQQVVLFSTTVQGFLQNAPTDISNLSSTLIAQANQAGITTDQIKQAVSSVTSPLLSFATSLPTNVINIVTAIASALINILLVIVISFYLTVDGRRIRDGIMSIVPERSKEHALLFEDALNRVVGNYIRGQLTLALIIGVLSGIVCLITGLGQFALLVGVMAFLFETIPMVGPTLASIPAIILSLLLPAAFPRTFWVIGAFVVIQAIESNVLGPRIVGHAVGLHPVASILALIVGTRLFGAFGALLATPIVAAAWVVIASLYRSARGETADQILARKRASWSIARPTGMLINSLRKPGITIPLGADDQPMEQEDQEEPDVWKDVHEKTPSP
jgi:predicted PurR-regulated permease PerM